MRLLLPLIAAFALLSVPAALAASNDSDEATANPTEGKYSGQTERDQDVTFTLDGDTVEEFEVHGVVLFHTDTVRDGRFSAKSGAITITGTWVDDDTVSGIIHGKSANHYKATLRKKSRR
jgi:hypothetical protein